MGSNHVDIRVAYQVSIRTSGVPRGQVTGVGWGDLLPLQCQLSGTYWQAVTVFGPILPAPPPSTPPPQATGLPPHPGWP